MMVFLDVLGPLGLKIVDFDPPSGTPPGLKILKNRPQNRKNRNRYDFRFFCLTKSFGNWILTEIDTLKPTGSGARPVFVFWFLRRSTRLRVYARGRRKINGDGDGKLGRKQKPV